MKPIAGWLGAAILAFTFTGCGDSAPTTAQEATPDGRPAGFEDMMKGMEKDMKKATANPKAMAKASAAANEK